MANQIFDRIAEVSSTTGTGSFALGGAVSAAYRAFQAVFVTNDTPWYLAQAVDGSGNPTGQWESGQGTFTSPATLARTTVFANSSNNTSLISFTGGNLQIWNTLSSGVILPLQQGCLFGPNSQTSNYTLALSDLGGIVLLGSGAGAAITVTIPPSASVAWPTSYGSLGVVPSIYIINQNSTYSITVAQGSGVTLNRRDGASGTGSRTIGTNSEAQIKFYGSNNWDISGSALS